MAKHPVALIDTLITGFQFVNWGLFSSPFQWWSRTGTGGGVVPAVVIECVEIKRLMSYDLKRGIPVLATPQGAHGSSFQNLLGQRHRARRAGSGISRR